MKLLQDYFQRIDESEKFRTIPGNPIDFFQYILRYQPELEDMTDEQVQMLIDVLEGLQVYLDDYADNMDSNAENQLGTSFAQIFKRYRYRHDPNLDNSDLDSDGEEVYEWLVVRYEKS